MFPSFRSGLSAVQSCFPCSVDRFGAMVEGLRVFVATLTGVQNAGVAEEGVRFDYQEREEWPCLPVLHGFRRRRYDFAFII